MFPFTHQKKFQNATQGQNNQQHLPKNKINT